MTEGGEFPEGDSLQRTAAAEEKQKHKRGQGDGSVQSKRCALWMPAKRRFCASHALPTSLYCGNHIPSAAETRVPCPIDPSHTILQEEVASHVKKCSATKHLKHFEEQSYFCKGLNAGSDGEEDLIAHAHLMRVKHSSDSNLEEDLKSVKNIIPLKGGKHQSSSEKRSAITGLSEDDFREFVSRIESAHEACSHETVQESVLQPTQCLQWWDRERDKRLPFQEKHVSQQASMLGNLEAFGLLPSEHESATLLQNDKGAWVYVEFGAGRGYLSHMLCDSYGVSSVVLVERKAYKYKADRTLRQITGVSLERLRTDIEDLNIKGVKALKGRHYVGISKHLCGPATDLTLRCCLRGLDVNSNEPSDGECLASEPVLEGIGIATCCHHLCQWKSYVNKGFFLNLGFSVQDFNMITWLTSWAVNGSGRHDLLDIESSEGQNLKSEELPKDADVAVNQGPRLSEAMAALTVSERADLGRKCKGLIDFGRLQWLRHCGMEGKLVNYISSTVSPENKLILVRKCLS